MESEIVVHFCNSEKPLHLFEENSYIVEDVCLSAAKHCGIGPVSRHLFALWYPLENIWLPLCRKLEVYGGKKWNLYFRLRFKMSSIRKLKEETDSKTFDYYFHQSRNDFLDGKIPELFSRSLRDRALGLVAADIIRQMLEWRLSPDTMKYNSRDFLPQELKRSPIWDNFLKDPLQKAVSKGWINSKQNTQFVKEEYLQQLHDLVPEYCSEKFTALIDDNGKVYEVILVVNPYHTTHPGLRMRLQRCKEVWTHICSIDDLCYISMKQGEETVEISRQNGVPQYVNFQGINQMHSFVSLLDGYYRLMEKWTFNLCKDLTTPSLLLLRSMKCHGPVGYVFAYQKLQDKCNNAAGSYLLRESRSKYNEYRLDICLLSGSGNDGKPQTLEIYKDEDSNFALRGYELSFPSISQLLAHYIKSGELKLKTCIPPSEYDKTRLLLCRTDNQDNHPVTVRGDCNCSAQCIPHDAMIFSKNYDDFFGKQTVVHYAHLKRSSGEVKGVAVKTLRKETKVTHLQEFLSQCDKVLFWLHDAIVSTVGMVLTQPTALVMEFLPLGRLDHYLQKHKNELKQVDLVEATYHLARALWYLEEQQCCHGKIRCHNILVACHTENSFKVKLSDPGIISYSDADIHWIPPEWYHDYSVASKSITSDVFSFGTTLWQIFSYGIKPLLSMNPREAKEWYQKGNNLGLPLCIHSDIRKLILECWVCDPDSRKRPQAIVRDVNQILYEVYNSRRSHSYATIGPGNTPVIPDNPSPRPPTPPSNRPAKETGLNILKNVFKWQTHTSNGTFSYDPLSHPTNNASSGQSTCTILTYVDRVPVASLDSICEGDPDQIPEDTNQNSGDLSWVIDKEQLTIKGTLGQGFYGEVLKATLTHCSGLRYEDVAVKRIRMTNESSECYTDLKREIEIMKNLRHDNIVEIKGLVEDPETMLVMEYLELGSLLAYLQLHKNKLNSSHLLKFAADVAEGMEYLEQKHIVHRDLAARNILVASERHVKISDFGLAQFTEDHYYRMRTERNLPIRWYSLESITEGKFSHKSDVWSYGITLWEMFSFGENPGIPGVPDTALSEALQQGQRLGFTPGCPSLVYSLMRSCWEKCSHERPSFSEILKKVTELQEELCS